MDNIFRSVDHHQANFTKQIRSSVQNNFYNDDLMMVSWPKYVIKVKIKLKTYIIMLDWNLKLFVFF